MDDTAAGQTQHPDNHRLGALPTPPFSAGDSNWGGIRANLLEMEKKLDELQQQVGPAQGVGFAASGEAPPQAPVAMPAAHAQAVQIKQQIENLLRVRE